MEARSPRVSEWGGVVWGIAAAVLFVGGVLESLMTGRLGRTEHSGARNSTDVVLRPVIGSVQGTDEARRWLPQGNRAGTFAFVFPDNNFDLSAPAIALSLLAWPSDVLLVAWDGSEAARRRLDSAAEERRFLIGTLLPIPGYRFEPLGPQFWKLIPGDPP
jgi:hypothetical protein